MSFTNPDPWNNFKAQVNNEARAISWECASCSNTGPGPIGLAFSMRDPTAELIRSYRDHLKSAHNIWPQCGFFVVVANRKFFCVLNENHMRDTYSPGDRGFELGAVPHKFEFEISIEAEQDMIGHFEGHFE